MSRLIADAKGNYYPLAPEVVDSILERLRPPQGDRCNVLDPVAGESYALLQLADGLDADPWAIELAENRAAIVKALIDKEHVLAPADMFRCHVSPGSFSLVYLNPPFTSSTGGGRAETSFLKRATPWIADGGVLVFVAPEEIVDDYEVTQFMEECFTEISAFRAPVQFRHYAETIVLGVKRKTSVPRGYLRSSYNWLQRHLAKNITYQLPPGKQPRVFRTIEPTDAELTRLVAASPIRFMLDRLVDDQVCARPPLSIGIGHRAMLLASGHINGLIQPPDELPHVVKGTARKEQFVASCTTEESESGGTTTTRTVISEKPRLTIRVLTADGQLVTLE